ncbi:hypothetical protein AVEN_197936-1 [Araneus ventricosus]|uniref:Uncharacterized protein n=1 Tax=Araneus ventricosus TaxID=182803 RepID=A0A4Y2CJJ4_ARAVE|nr:hypothetical protein AVEN_197936-1 [Araneus ventricosus]
MNRPTVPNLESLATLKVAVLLYNNPEVRELAKLVIFEDFDIRILQEWKQLMHSKMSKILIPTRLQEIIANVASQVCLQIWDKNIQFHAMHWKISLVFGRHCQCLKGLLPSIYRWTPNGSIDFRKTVQALVQDQRVDMAFRFSLSCYYVLGNETISLWNAMPESTKKRFFENDLVHGLKDRIERFLIVGDVKWYCFVSQRRKTPHEIISECNDVEFLDSIFQKIGKEWKCNPEIHGKMYHLPGFPSWWDLDTATHTKCLVQLDDDLGFTWLTCKQKSKHFVFQSIVFEFFKRARQTFMDSATHLWTSVQERSLSYLFFLIRFGMQKGWQDGNYIDNL